MTAVEWVFGIVCAMLAPGALRKPQPLEDQYWRCSCGTENVRTYVSCIVCRRRRDA